MPNMMPAKSDSRRRLNATGAAAASDYVKISEDVSEPDGFINEQWTTVEVQEPTPWKTICIILALFVGGTICICCAALDWMSDTNKERSDRTLALIVIGALTIIPGGYYCYILMSILLNRKGYSMDDIRRLG